MGLLLATQPFRPTASADIPASRTIRCIDNLFRGPPILFQEARTLSTLHANMLLVLSAGKSLPRTPSAIPMDSLFYLSPGLRSLELLPRISKEGLFFNEFVRSFRFSVVERTFTTISSMLSVLCSVVYYSSYRREAAVTIVPLSCTTIARMSSRFSTTNEST